MSLSPPMEWWVRSLVSAFLSFLLVSMAEVPFGTSDSLPAFYLFSFSPFTSMTPYDQLIFISSNRSSIYSENFHNQYRNPLNLHNRLISTSNYSLILMKIHIFLSPLPSQKPEIKKKGKDLICFVKFLMTNSVWQIRKLGSLCWGAFSFKKWLTVCQVVKEILHEKRKLVNIMSKPYDFIMYILNIHEKNPAVYEHFQKLKYWSYQNRRFKELFFYSLIPSSYSCPNIFDFKTLLFSL